MSLQETGPETDLDDASFDAILQYDWNNDVEFQSGLQSILSSGKTPQDVAELTLKAKCYYFSQKSQIPINPDLFREYVLRKAGKARPASPSPQPPALGQERIPPFNPTSLHDDPDTTDPNHLRISSLDRETHIPPPDASLPPTTQEQSPAPATFSTSAAGTSSAENQAPYPTSFAHIVELITTGQPIPGIREIPNKLNEEKPAPPSAKPRGKPWERKKEDAEVKRELPPVELGVEHVSAAPGEAKPGIPPADAPSAGSAFGGKFGGDAMVPQQP